VNRRFLFVATVLVVVLGAGIVCAAGGSTDGAADFPRALDSYEEADIQGIGTILKNRVQQEPFNLAATLIFFLAIIHTFMTSKFTTLSHQWSHEHKEKIRRGEADRNSVHLGAELFHFLGEVEVVFGLWAGVLVGAIVVFYDWGTVIAYVGHKVNFTEAAFVVVIMTLASTRPILKLAETIMERIAKLLGGSLAALWLTILTIGPLLGSFITEPAAMTISALLLSEKFFELGPSNRFKYATLGLLFVNISVGGTLTHFAAPPVLMVAEPWGWGAPGFMPLHFGWKAALGILMSNGLYFLWFRKEISTLQHDYELGVVRDDIEQRFVTRSRIQKEFERIVVALKADQTLFASISETTAGVVDEIRKRMEAEMLPGLKEEGVDPELIREAFDKRFEEVRMAKMRELLPGLLPEDEREYIDPHWDEREDSVPFWVTAVHILFMGWTIANAHYPPLFVIGMLFFLGFAQITMPYQNRIRLQAPMLVGFFLAGLVIHGGVQGWWIAPVLGSLSEWPLMITATVLTAFNDNAAITYLATLVPGFTDSLKYAVVAGAVSGGGLTIIANAPNPAGQSILKRHFDNAVSPAGLLMAALIPTIIVFLCYALL
jgi:hypothetical protein